MLEFLFKVIILEPVGTSNTVTGTFYLCSGERLTNPVNNHCQVPENLYNGNKS